MPIYAYPMRRITHGLLALALAAVTLSSAAIGQCNLQWQASNTNGGVTQLKRLSNGDIVAVGGFTVIDGVAATGVARYDETGWHAIGNGIAGGAFDIAEMPNEGIVAQTQTGLVIWDGMFWQPGPTPPSYSAALKTFIACLPNGNLISAGAQLPPFTSYVEINEWNGSSWQIIGTSFGSTSQSGARIVGLDILPSGELVAAGDWARLAPHSTLPTSYNEVMRWDGSLWHTVLDIPEPETLHITRTGVVVAAGRFSFRSSTPVSYCPANGPLHMFALTDLPNGDIVAGGLVVLGPPATATLHRCGWSGSGYTELATGATLPTGLEFAKITAHDDGTILVAGTVTIGGTSTPLAYLKSTCPTAVTSTPTTCTGSSGPITLSATQTAWAGSQLGGEASGFASNSIGINVLSLQTQATPLASLLPQGLPNCDLMVSPDALTIAMPTAGVTSFSLDLPNTSAVAGIDLHLQTLQIEPTGVGTQWELSGSNRLTFTIGVF